MPFDDSRGDRDRSSEDRERDRDIPGLEPDDDRGDDRRRDERQRSPAGDLDEMWDDFTQLLGPLLGGRGAGKRRPASPGGGSNEPPRRPVPGLPSFGGPSLRGLALLLAVVLLGWLATGFYIVPEGQVGVVTTFGRYTKDTPAGFNWRLPWPVQDTEILDVSSVRKAEIGIKGTTSRLKEALMLTDDENIVDLKYNVQYRVRMANAKEFLFRSRDPDQSVVQAAESAMREVVGRKKMDSVLFESKQEIAENVRVAMQDMLDRYSTGIEVLSVAIQNAQPPEQVQAAFNDAVKAGQDRERQINEGEAYANAIVPKARGQAARLVQEAEGYRARVVETATGDGERFKQVLAQYQRAPEVTRDRLFIDRLRDLYGRTAKVLVDTREGSSLLYLPLDKIVDKHAASVSAAASAENAAAAIAAQGGADGGNAAGSSSPESPAGLRSRSR